MKNSRKQKSGFSLVEVLAAVAIIGILVFIAIPNVVQARRDAEEHFAISRAEAMNSAVSQYIQAMGRGNAGTTWTGKTDDQKYTLIKGYLAYAPADRTTYTPNGYTFTFGATPDTKVVITRANGTSTPDTIAY